MFYKVLIISLLCNVLLGSIIILEDVLKWGDDNYIYQQVVKYTEPITAVEFVDVEAECKENEYRSRLNYEYRQHKKYEKELGTCLIDLANMQNKYNLENIKATNLRNSLYGR